jgi:hypothetical protein
VSAGDSGADIGDRSGTFEPKIGRCSGWRRIESLALQQVSPVHARSGDVDHYLAVARYRIGDFLPAEHIRISRLGYHDRAHGSLLSRELHVVKVW